MIDECHLRKKRNIMQFRIAKRFYKIFFHLMVIDDVGRYPMTIK